MFSAKYGISREGERRWTLGRGVNRDYITHSISFSQESYINNLVKRFDLQNAAIVTTPLELTALSPRTNVRRYPRSFGICLVTTIES